MNRQSPPEMLISKPSRPERLAEIFRQEALDHRNRAAIRQGEPLATSAARLQWALWALVGSLALFLILAGNLEIDEFVSGPAVVRSMPMGDGAEEKRMAEEGRSSPGAPGQSGRVSVSCLVFGRLPVRDQTAIRPGARARLLPAEPGIHAPIEVEVESVETRPQPADTGGDRRTDPGTFSNGETSLEVVGHVVDLTSLPAGMDAGRGGTCPDGLTGSLKLRLPPRKLLFALIPAPSIPW